MTANRPISLPLLGKAAIRIGARQADSDLGLALASLGVVMASLRRAPERVALPDLADVATLIPPEQRPHAEAILAAAAGIVEWLAAEADASLAAATPAGTA